MTPPSHSIPISSSPLPVHSPHPARSPHTPTMLDARPPHPDFLGTPDSQDPNYLQDTLGLDLHFNYSLNVTEDSSFSSEVSEDATSVPGHADYASTWSTSPQHPADSLLFANHASPYLSDLSLPSPSPSALSLTSTYHDSYWANSATNPMHPPSANLTRTFPPRIHIETEFPADPVASPYTAGSAFPHSPTTYRSPSAMMVTPVHPYSSPSSVGSAPPVTPETPALEHGYHSPFINQSSNSPISPSLISAPTISFAPKDPLVVPQRGVLDLAHAAGHPWGGPLVPQKTYRPHTLSDRRRYVEEVQLEAPIMFFTHNPAGCGILLKDALASKFSTLMERDDSMFEGRGPSVSIRLNWPGYAPWSRQIPTRDFRSPPHPITRAKLARNVAKTISRFIQEMESQRLEDAGEAKWRVGSRGIKLEDLMLVGLQHVSMGSWQAHVRLIRNH